MTHLRLTTLALSLALGPVAGCLGGQSSGNPQPTPTPAASQPDGSTSPTPLPTARPTPSPFSAELKKKTSLAFTQIRFGAAEDVVAVVKNLGTASVDLEAESWRLAGNSKYGKLGRTVTTIAGGAELHVHVNAPWPCTETATESCAETGTEVAKAKGNLALFKGISTEADFLDAGKMVDFVEWGEIGQTGEKRAVDARLWDPALLDYPVLVPAGTDSISVKVSGDSGQTNWQ